MKYFIIATTITSLIWVLIFYKYYSAAQTEEPPKPKEPTHEPIHTTTPTIPTTEDKLPSSSPQEHTIVQAEKMNILYIGMENAITILSNMPAEELKISASGAGVTLVKLAPDRYIANVTQIGETTINILNTRTQNKTTHIFRTTRLPDPIVEIGGKRGGLISAREMQAQLGMIPTWENMDFDAKCEIQSYTLYYTKKRQDPIEIKAIGGRFSGNEMRAIQAGAVGDQYAFVDIKARCPGDAVGRMVGSMAFLIK